MKAKIQSNVLVMVIVKRTISVLVSSDGILTTNAKHSCVILLIALGTGSAKTAATATATTGGWGTVAILKLAHGVRKVVLCVLDMAVVTTPLKIANVPWVGVVQIVAT